MATTTNYGWTTPDDTALVKDGAAAIRSLGTAVDTTTKALNPSTTLGDIEYRSSTANTNTRLGIGSNGQVLTVASGVPSWATPSDQTPLTTKGDLFTFSTTDARLAVGTNGYTLVADSAEATGLKWAAPSSGAMTKISSGSISNTATFTVDSVFTSTYYNYIIKLAVYSSSSLPASDLLCRLRKNDATTFTSGYSAGGQKITRSGTISAMASDNIGNFILSTDIGAGVNNRTSVTINYNTLDISYRPVFDWFGASNSDTPGLSVLGGGWVDGNNIYGIQFFASSGNISGEYAIYGVEK